MDKVLILGEINTCQLYNSSRIIVAYIIKQFNTNYWKDNLKQILFQIQDKEELPGPQRLVATAIWMMGKPERKVHFSIE